MIAEHAEALSRAAEAQDGTALQILLSQTNLVPLSDANRLSSFSARLAAPSTKNDVWLEVATLHAKVTSSLSANDVKLAWESMNTLIGVFLRFFATLQNGRWCGTTCVMLLSFHRSLSALADQRQATESEADVAGRRSSHLEECARQLSKAFSICVGDRTLDEEQSRKWTTYDVVGLLFRTYFKLKSLGLCRNILRALNAADLPTLDRFPRAQRVTFKYYVGLLAFLNEDYADAESSLTYAFANCPSSALHNRGMILRYLIPCGLLRGRMPSSASLIDFPAVSSLYRPFADAIRSGNVRAYDDALASAQTEKILVQMGTYLAVERAREICLRGLLKRVYRCKDRASRIHLRDFHQALRFVGVELDISEAEWLVASQIAKGYIRGYISHPHMTAVLSAQGPFPSLKSILVR